MICLIIVYWDSVGQVYEIKEGVLIVEIECVIGCIGNGEGLIIGIVKKLIEVCQLLIELLQEIDVLEVGVQICG